MDKRTRVIPIRGMEDILFPESSDWTYVEKKAREILSLYGFEEVRTPIVELKELFVRSVGEGSAVVDKEMYDFVDKGGNEVALRPEGTASVVRAFIASGKATTEKFGRFYYIGPMFRYERPQKGRQRQFHQIGIELLGASSPQADAECIAMVPHLLDDLGIKNWSLKINSLGCKLCRVDFQKDFLKFVEGKNDNLCSDCQKRLIKNPMRLLDCKAESCRTELKDAPMISSYWCEECRTHFHSLKDSLSKSSIKFVEDHRIVRGLDYYVRTAFEFTSSDLGAQDAFLGGGRYDGLVNDLGGPDVPGVGWAIGMERLMLLVERNKKLQGQGDVVYFALLGESALGHALPIIQKLRRDGIRIEWDYEFGSLKSQMKRADKIKAHTVVILGDEEIAKGHAMLRNMKDGKQHEVKISDLPLHFVNVEM